MSVEGLEILFYEIRAASKLRLWSIAPNLKLLHYICNLSDLFLIHAIYCLLCEQLSCFSLVRSGITNFCIFVFCFVQKNHCIAVIFFFTVFVEVKFLVRFTNEWSMFSIIICTKAQMPLCLVPLGAFDYICSFWDVKDEQKTTYLSFQLH